MAYRIRSRFAAMPASSPAAVALFLAAMLGPIIVFAALMRLFVG